MQLRRRSKKNGGVSQHVRPSDIEGGREMRYERKHTLTLKTGGSLHCNIQHHFVVRADRLSLYLVGFAAFFFALDTAVFAYTTKGKMLESEQIVFDYDRSSPSPRAFSLPEPIMGGEGAHDTLTHIPDELWNLEPDFGGLIIATLKDGDRNSTIDAFQNKVEHLLKSEEHDEGGSDEEMYEGGDDEEMYEGGDDEAMHEGGDDEETYEEGDDEEMYNDPNCRTPSWYNTYKPSCNDIHEVNVGLGKYLASGHFRDAFSILNNAAVLKVTKLELPYDNDMMEMMRIDAMVMDLMKSSKNIVNIYGHCGISVLVDFIKGQNIDKLFVESERKEMDDPLALLSPTEKLNMALEMAEALSELHGFEGGVIVHGDVQYCQFLLDKDNHVFLSDFNRAEPLLWNDESQMYCKFYAGSAAGNVRSPEEYAERWLDEKIDIYSFGNILFTLLTGKEPYEDLLYYPSEYAKRVTSGNPPRVGLKIRGNSFAEAALAAIMDKCFEYFPEKRLDMFMVVSLLKDAVKLNDRLQGIKVSDVSIGDRHGYKNNSIPEPYYEEYYNEISDESDYDYEHSED